MMRCLANRVFTLDPSNHVIKRVWCIMVFTSNIHFRGEEKKYQYFLDKNGTLSGAILSSLPTKMDTYGNCYLC